MMSEGEEQTQTVYVYSSAELRAGNYEEMFNVADEAEEFLNRPGE